MTATPTASTCGLNNGAVNLSVSPAGAYTFIWSNGATTEDLSGIAAGAYSVTVTSTSSGCTATTTVTVTNNNPAINIAGNTNPVTSCTTPNGSIDITITFEYHTFIWSNGATTEDLVNIAAGTYSVTVSAGGSCTNTAIFTVASNTQPPSLTATPTASTCGLNNGAVNLSVSPAGAYTFLWSNGTTTEDLSGIAAGTYSVTVTSISSGCTATTTVTVTNNNPTINIAGNTNPVTSCTTPNGSIDITITPSNTYTFLWSNGATTEDLVNIAAGTYSVTVSAGGSCTNTAIFTVASNTQPPSLTATPTASTCGLNNGAVNLSVSPAGAYTFLWSNGATTEDLSGIAAGAFSVTVTSISSGCTATTTVTVTNNNPTINIAGNTNPVTSCTTPNGSIDITITPSNTYTFIWSTGATTEDLVNIATGTYSVTVSAGGSCTNTAIFTVVSNTIPPGLNVDITPSVCGAPDGAIDLIVSPAGAYQFTWSNGATTEDLTGLLPGNYSVTVTSLANGCSTAAIYNVPSNNTGFAISGIATPVTNCIQPNGAIDLSVFPAGTYTFSWSNGAGTEDLTGLPAGTYTVTVSDSGSCPPKPRLRL
ncbi:MAG: hypothetical protein IPJ40_16510 [Saprospirales bacterium]|nr:hypothetical protein [Saprospirales bacterium]